MTYPTAAPSQSAPPPQPSGGLVTPDAGSDAARRRDLRRMKAVALTFLLVAAVLWLVCRWLDARPGDPAAWVGFLETASEAGMVGGLADWFAVTALFRHPLGIPIPHTALIRKKKDQIGDQLGGFIEENFLTGDNIELKVGQLQIPARVAQWIADPANSSRISDEAGRVVRLASEMLDDDDIEQLLQAVVSWIAEPQWGPPGGRILESLVQEDRLAPVIQMLCDRGYDFAVGSEDLINRVIDTDAPSWTPKFVNTLVGDKIYREFVEFMRRVRDDPEHDIRRSVLAFVAQYAQDLQHDPATIAKIEQLKAEFLARDEVTGAASTAWTTGKSVIEQALTDQNATLRKGITDITIAIATRVRDDLELQQKLNFWTVRAARHVATTYSTEIISLITETVRSWDADDTSAKIELQVGRDLQFIRINGTVVGALAGLAIHTVSVLLF